jgi:hypothetical protein
MSTIWFSLIFFISLPFLAFAAVSIDAIDSVEMELLEERNSSEPSPSDRDAEWILTHAPAIAPSTRIFDNPESDDNILVSEDSSILVNEDSSQRVVIGCFRSVDDQNSYFEKFNPMGIPNPLSMTDLDRFEYIAAFFIVFIIASFLFAFL